MKFSELIKYYQLYNGLTLIGVREFTGAGFQFCKQSLFVIKQYLVSELKQVSCNTVHSIMHNLLLTLIGVREFTGAGFQFCKQSLFVIKQYLVSELKQVSCNTVHSIMHNLLHVLEKLQKCCQFLCQALMYFQLIFLPFC